MTRRLRAALKLLGFAVGLILAAAAAVGVGIVLGMLMLMIAFTPTQLNVPAPYTERRCRR